MRGGAADRVVLVGLDFGSTTSSAMAARARIALNCVTGRMEFSQPEVIYRSQPVFTPFSAGGDIDVPCLGRHLERWLREGGIAPGQVFAGGAIVTGLASARANACALAAFVEARLGEAVVATARDPVLESWLAFMGSCAGLSRAFPARPILNLDIGGGTTNSALGRAGTVTACGCHFVGARHLRFAPGTYRLTGMSPYARPILDALGIAGGIGDTLRREEVAAITGFHLRALEALADGDDAFFAAPPGDILVDVPLRRPAGPAPAVTLSGGVGALVYARMAGAPFPSTTAFGDLGIDLARAILASPRLSRDLARLVPEHGGRATVCGLTLHSTAISGTTVFLPPQVRLPLKDLPIVATLPPDAAAERFAAAFALIARTRGGGGLRLSGAAPLGLDAVRSLGARLKAALAASPLDAAHPAVVLMGQNAAKAVGSYATDWGRAPAPLVVIDEVAEVDAQFARIGRPAHGIVPVSFYGLN